MKNFRQLERYSKGFANHRRIQIMSLLAQQPEQSVEDIADKLIVNYKTISEHTRRLAIAGLVMKRHEGNEVRHKLTDCGQTVLKFLRKLE